MSDPAAFSVASVIIDDAIDKSLDYHVPEELRLQINLGTRVLVPVQGSLRKATVVDRKEKSSFSKLKSIQSIQTEKSFLSPELFALGKWVSSYYCTSFRKVLPLLLPPGMKQDAKSKTQLFVSTLVDGGQIEAILMQMGKKQSAQVKILKTMRDYPEGVWLSDLLKETKSSKTALESLISKNLISCVKKEKVRDPLEGQEYFSIPPKKLNPEQEAAFLRIQQSLQKKEFSAHLLHGVTGSGKTEIYLHAICETLRLGKSALVLVPEISLTAQTIETLKGRFQMPIAVFHHKLSIGERFDAWQKVQKGEISIVLGARSAVFAPLSNLGLIVVDEEHDSSYKQQDDCPCYQARDVAVMRANFSKCTILLGSATPSLESYSNAINGKYQLHTLKARATANALPKVNIVDMKKEKQKGNHLFSDPLLQAIGKRLQKGEQTILFLNRRGYHTIKVCTHCQNNLHCPNCDVSMTYHKEDNYLACHLCGYEIMPAPRTCSFCGAIDAFSHQSPGTELVERSLHAIFPDCRTLRIDADTTRKKNGHESLLKQFRSGKADILIGTQMIAKGLHFPSVTLVGILNTDAGLHVPDFRASEQIFQLITQVAGRAGRAEIEGEVFIQTYLLDHMTIQLGAAQDFEKFSVNELGIRKAFDFPPFTHMVKFLFSGENELQTEKAAHEYRLKLISRLPQDFHIHPVAKSGHAKINNRFRFQFLLRAKKLGNLSDFLNDISSEHLKNKKIQLFIDVDPITTFF